MLRKATDLIGHSIHATDGDIGSVNTVYFDDERWTVRYLVVDTGKWLPGRRVLISPVSVRSVSWNDESIGVSLLRDQVRNSPDIDTEQPVSRQHELDYYAYYGYPYYWGGAGLWGTGAYPAYLARAEMIRGMEEARAEEDPRNLKDSHLRDVAVVKGYHIRATDGDIGHVADFLVEDTTWAIRYLVVDTGNWLTGGRNVLIAPAWVREVNWAESIVEVTMTREAVKSSPETLGGTIDRQYEQRLHEHYGRPVYWTGDDVARVGSANLARLDELDDLEVADGELDVRGWRVVAADGNPVGKVEHLIVDRSAMKVRHLEVGLERGAASAHRDVLIPLEHADLDERTEEVRMRSATATAVAQLPPFEGFPLDPGYEERLRVGLSSATSPAASAREVRLGQRPSPDRPGSDVRGRDPRIDSEDK